MIGFLCPELAVHCMPVVRHILRISDSTPLLNGYFVGKMTMDFDRTFIYLGCMYSLVECIL